MYRFATCNDLIELKCKHPNLSFPGTIWGLKMMGYLFVYDHIHNRSRQSILEVGGGLSTIFDELVGNEMDYHMADKPGFYDESKFQDSIKKRKNTTFHPVLVGEYSQLLSDNSFDVIFSISALEHVPFEQIPNVCMDMYRLLKPGGTLIHTIDIYTLERTDKTGIAYYNEMRKCGFQFDSEPDIEWTWISGKPILLEPLEVVYTYYLGKKNDMWSEPTKVNDHAATILTLAKK